MSSRKHLLFDRAFIIGTLSKLWPAVAGLLTIGLIATRFTPTEQGYYVTFLTIVQLSVFFEMGLSQVIVQFVSHESAKLSLGSLGEPTGNAETLGRLSGISRLVHAWFAIAALVMFFFVGFGGYYFFSMQPDNPVTWKGPWLLLIFGASLDLAFLPAESLLQGCDRYAYVYSYRLLRSIVRLFVLWGAMISGLALWSGGIALLVSLIVGVPRLLLPHRKLFTSLLARRESQRVDWKREIFPVQWRMAVSWISGYFIQSLFAPLAFHFLGPVEAGRVGISVAIASMLSAVATTWPESRQARFGMLVAAKDWYHLDQGAIRIGALAFGTAILGALGVVGIILFLQIESPLLAQRFLPLFGTVCFLLTAPINAVINTQATYLRSHKKEPFMPLSVLNGVLTALSATLTVIFFGPEAMGAAYLAITMLVILPLASMILWQRRREWHGIMEL